MEGSDQVPANAGTVLPLSGAEFRRRIRWLILHTWSIPPVFGLGFILLIGVLTPEQVLGILATPIEPAYILCWLAFSLWYLPRSVQSVTDWLDGKPGSSADMAVRAVQRFPLRFWTTFLVYLAIAPASVIWAAELYTGFEATPYDWFRIELVALIVSIIVGLPIFFLIFDVFGRALGGVSLTRPIVTIRTKVFLIGSLVPLLIDTILVQYYWTRTGYFTLETFGVWLVLEMVAISGSLVFAHSFGQSLAPLQQLIGVPRPLPEARLSALSPLSTDELGLLTTDYRTLLLEQRRHNALLELSNRLLRSAGSDADTAAVINSVVELCQQAIGVDLAFLIVHDPVTNELVGVAQTGAAYEPQGHYRLSLTDQSLAVWCFNHRETAMAPDATLDPRISPELRKRFGTRSVLAAPMRLGEEELGVLMVAHTARTCHFGPHEQALVEGLAREAAYALHAQRLRAGREHATQALLASQQRLQNQQGALIRLADQQANAEQDISQVLHATTETVANTLGVARVSVWSYSRVQQQLVCLDLFDSGPRRHSQGRVLQEQDNSAYFEALLGNQPIVAEDAHTHPHTREFTVSYLNPLGIGAMLDAPIHRGGQAIGVLCCEHVGGRRVWNTDEQNFTSAVANFVSLCLELHDHHRTAEELKRHREHLEELVATRTSEVQEQARIIDQIHDSVVQTDLDGMVTGWNKGAERLFGWRAEEALGRYIGFVYSSEDLDFLRDAVIAPLRSKGQHEVEVHMVRKTGERFVAHLSMSMLNDADGRPRGMIGYSLDITENKRTEALALHRERELAAANHELESFSYSVSHDLRAPLRAVNGFARALSEDCAAQLDVQGREYLQRIMNATRHMGVLIDDLLQLSRVGRAALNPQPVDLTAQAWVAVEELRTSAPERQVDVVIASGLTAHGDPGLLSVVLANLFGNAWKYTSHTKHARIEFNAIEENGESVYFIRDNGVGFDMQYAGKLFGAFQRLHRAEDFPGTGIGLATVQRIIHRHGGRVWAQAAPAQGATFSFTLGKAIYRRTEHETESV